MQVVQPYEKRRQIVATVIRSASCSHGWLRLLVQAIFGIIIVSSFIMIQLMVIRSSKMYQPRPRRRCIVENCRVICNDAPYFGEFEDHVFHAVGETPSHCERVFLTLQRPMFHNSSLPGHWLSVIRTNVTELEIVGGNLQYISPNAFMSQFGGNIRVLVFTKVTINTMTAETFLGLSNLLALYIKNSIVMNVMPNAMQAIGATLKLLRIKAERSWNPVSLTGSSDFKQLLVVDLSMNMFHDILGRNSFSKLYYCKILNLSWGKITAIGAGAFDSLKNIQILHLSHNYLVTLPSDIFNKIIPLEPRVSLHENSWECSCINQNLRILSKMDMLIVDPVCQYPTSFHGVTFSEFEKYCDNGSITEYIDDNLYIFSERSNAAYHQQCKANSSTDNFAVKLRSPLPEFKCTSNRIDRSILNPNINALSADSDWLTLDFSVESNRFSMVSLVFSGPYECGLMWYKSSCPSEVYCINHLPKGLKVFNIDSSTQYTFCKASFKSGEISSDRCVVYDLSSLLRSTMFYKSVLLLACIAITSLLLGALCVYALIHRNPILLKGNKRVVFVKHKTVDALILPPKIPLRRNLTDDLNTAAGNSDNIFIIPETPAKSIAGKFIRNNSVMTDGSSHPSYISALQPTEDQLAQWRITRHFELNCTYDTNDSNLSNHSLMNNSEYLPYFSLDNPEKLHDNAKL